jgi:deoxyhypusine synthase
MGDIRLTEKVECIRAGKKTVSELLHAMGRTAYQGRRLAEATATWEAMLRADGLTIVMGFAGSMSTAGQWELVNWLIDNRFIDVLVSTGANVSEDIVDAMGPGYWQGSPDADNAALLQEDLNRYYDVYGKETDYREMELLLTEFTLTLDPRAVYSSMEVLYRLGGFLGARGVRSIATLAAERGVPVFCPALADSAFGEAFLMARNRGHRIVVDQVRDFEQFVGIGEMSQDIGVVYLGGGVPKDYTQLLAISLSPMAGDEAVAGREGFLRKGLQEYYYPHRYAVQITTDAPQWGGLSGCTLEEAVSWGKVAGDGRHVTCYCDATIALPLIVHALQERVPAPRRGRDLSKLFADAPA